MIASRAVTGVNAPTGCVATGCLGRRLAAGLALAIPRKASNRCYPHYGDPPMNPPDVHSPARRPSRPHRHHPIRRWAKRRTIVSPSGDWPALRHEAGDAGFPVWRCCGPIVSSGSPTTSRPGRRPRSWRRWASPMQPPRPPGIYGLYATIVPLIADDLRPSRILSSGPDSSLAAIILAITRHRPA